MRPASFGSSMVPVDASTTAASIAADERIADLALVDSDLAGLAELAVDAQLAVFAGIHQRLIDALAASGGPGSDPAGTDRPGVGRPDDQPYRPGKSFQQRGR